VLLNLSGLLGTAYKFSLNAPLRGILLSMVLRQHLKAPLRGPGRLCRKYHSALENQVSKCCYYTHTFTFMFIS
jgi:hypothetical protein